MHHIDEFNFQMYNILKHAAGPPLEGQMSTQHGLTIPVENTYIMIIYYSLIYTKSECFTIKQLWKQTTS